MSQKLLKIKMDSVFMGHEWRQADKSGAFVYLVIVKMWRSFLIKSLADLQAPMPEKKLQLTSTNTTNMEAYIFFY